MPIKTVSVGVATFNLSMSEKATRRIMRLLPPNPTFKDFRDAIISIDDEDKSNAGS